ncbi:hypothetical protein VKI21_05915 [Cyanobacterium aponinum UTEX 3222]|uniref:Uncharacterized protein n=3 Tax=Cyanobacterium aponinum TaxID=379064 RepID=K9Z6N9_CYAAP|nr:hypothetical protein [Cyanobacterium aponinum]WRL43219.1 hypothetical protein VKI21_05915 [Cyanobacterium aponinum UTEX 3222]AFZ54799.1 hypothetical protein Cyan10605_2727 [Cyanobacterium aponinum PCC 10605]MBD2395559.1 hypothetical protein [Cyanobacterium aponinum FACHB-4101]MTF38249.1 hypothetical protein [Cyanobacterium aponinum 0216]PHV64061.1 hypothetical protein CSQ80_02105 [Cyanobacterium aponinum IPPAS B-1201]
MSEDTQKLRKMIENALADGVLSRAESEMIKREIYADKKVTPEEARLWQDLQRKISDGEVEIN